MLAIVANTSKLRGGEKKKEKTKKKKWSYGSWPHGQCKRPQDKKGGINYWHSNYGWVYGLCWRINTTHTYYFY
jgi:hypothetical protein